MLEHYSHIRKEAKRPALAALCIAKSKIAVALKTAKAMASAPPMAQTMSQRLLDVGERNTNLQN
jgi:hypothetical protein